MLPLIVWNDSILERSIKFVNHDRDDHSTNTSSFCLLPVWFVLDAIQVSIIQNIMILFKPVWWAYCKRRGGGGGVVDGKTPIQKGWGGRG